MSASDDLHVPEKRSCCFPFPQLFASSSWRSFETLTGEFPVAVEAQGEEGREAPWLGARGAQGFAQEPPLSCSCSGRSRRPGGGFLRSVPASGAKWVRCERVVLGRGKLQPLLPSSPCLGCPVPFLRTLSCSACC